MKPAICGLLLIALAPIALADPLLPLIERYEAHVRAGDPDSAATARRTVATRWQDVSPAAESAHRQQAEDLLAAIAAAETERRTDQAILIRLLSDEISYYDQDASRIPFVGDWGFQAEPHFAAMILRIRTEADAHAWIARLNDVPRYFHQQRENMKRGIATGWTAHGDPFATTRAQIAALLEQAPEDSDLYQPLRNLPDSISPESRSHIQKVGLEATKWALAAYESMLEFMDETYAPAARAAPGIASLPGGQEIYAALVEVHTAGAGYSPEEVHAIGVAEVARIRAEMEAIIEEVGFEGSFAEFQHFLRTDPQFYAETEAELMEAAREISARLDLILPDYFNILPRLGYTVDPVPASIAPGYTTGRYVLGDPEEGRPGSYLVNTWALDQRPLYELPALSAHEAVPGHHLQIALAQEMAGQPRFRQQYYATAFGEGWGLYAEYLAGEAGIYRTPYERFGALSYEMWRACRLVADTGLHWYGWSREEAEACFKDNTALAPLNIETEVTRYIGWPGQAVGYKIGELKIRELRAEAQAALGDAFDIRAFHDTILGQGSVPMDLLEAQVRGWIASSAAP
ncbi:DUF885 domain-containing protein [Hyphomonas sp.]|uniref:DUF885 domain-containing protein n=1 Tax=Hyphomonas sp. TaxID=87 RepID=UPI00391AE1AC